MKRSFKISFLVLVVLLFSKTVTVFALGEPIYRVYNPVNGEHLFTNSQEEVLALTTNHGWKDEGIAWFSPSNAKEYGENVHRLYNSYTKLHLYTADSNEKQVLSSKYEWTFDNNGYAIFYSGGNVPIYRLYSPATTDHHLTTDQNEYETLGANGWVQEGIAFYALTAGNQATSNPIPTPSEIKWNDPNNSYLLVKQYDQSCFNQLNDIEKQNYETILSGIRNLDSYIKTQGLTRENLIKVIHSVENDHPDLFYLYTTSSADDGTITVKYLVETPEELTQKQAEVENWANTVLSTINPSASQREIAQEIHDYIIKTTEYDGNAWSGTGQTLLSVVEGHRSVCAGFTKAYAYLLNRAGIFSINIGGQVRNVALENHLWSLDNLDGTYSYTDITTDEVSSAPDYISHVRFAVRKSSMEVDFVFDPTFHYPD